MKIVRSPHRVDYYSCERALLCTRQVAVLSFETSDVVVSFRRTYSPAFGLNNQITIDKKCQYKL